MTDSREDRVGRFRRFVMESQKLFSIFATNSFQQVGRGVVSFRANQLRGGEAFEPQDPIPMQYQGTEAWADKPVPRLRELLSDYDPSAEAIIMCLYESTQDCDVLVMPLAADPGPSVHVEMSPDGGEGLN